jgi:hypothetical protein
LIVEQVLAVIQSQRVTASRFNLAAQVWQKNLCDTVSRLIGEIDGSQSGPHVVLFNNSQILITDQLFSISPSIPKRMERFNPPLG